VYTIVTNYIHFNYEWVNFNIMFAYCLFLLSDPRITNKICVQKNQICAVRFSNRVNWSFIKLEISSYWFVILRLFFTIFIILIQVKSISNYNILHIHNFYENLDVVNFQFFWQKLKTFFSTLKANTDKKTEDSKYLPTYK